MAAAHAQRRVPRPVRRPFSARSSGARCSCRRSIADRSKAVGTASVDARAKLIERGVRSDHVQRRLDGDRPIGISRLIRAIQAGTSHVLRAGFPAPTSRLPGLSTPSSVAAVGHPAPREAAHRRLPPGQQGAPLRTDCAERCIEERARDVGGTVRIARPHRAVCRLRHSGQRGKPPAVRPRVRSTGFTHSSNIANAIAAAGGAGMISIHQPRPGASGGAIRRDGGLRVPICGWTRGNRVVRQHRVRLANRADVAAHHNQPVRSRSLAVTPLQRL